MQRSVYLVFVRALLILYKGTVYTCCALVHLNATSPVLSSPSSAAHQAGKGVRETERRVGVCVREHTHTHTHSVEVMRIGAN